MVSIVTRHYIHYHKSAVVNNQQLKVWEKMRKNARQWVYGLKSFGSKVHNIMRSLCDPGVCHWFWILITVWGPDHPCPVREVSGSGQQEEWGSRHHQYLPGTQGITDVDHWILSGRINWIRNFILDHEPYTGSGAFYWIRILILD